MESVWSTWIEPRWTVRMDASSPRRITVVIANKVGALQSDWRFLGRREIYSCAILTPRERGCTGSNLTDKNPDLGRRWASKAVVPNESLTWSLRSLSQTLVGQTDRSVNKRRLSSYRGCIRPRGFRTFTHLSRSYIHQLESNPCSESDVPQTPEATLIPAHVSGCDIFDGDTLTFRSQEAKGHGWREDPPRYCERVI